MVFGQLILLVWIPVVLCIFIVLPPRRAVLVSFLGGWMFLPSPRLGMPLNAMIKLKGLPEIDKILIISISVLLAVCILDQKRLFRFRIHWLDVPMLIWCLCPFASALANGQTFFDGLSESVVVLTTWGLPYFFGRIYFNDPAGLRELAIGLVIAGLIYVPFCLWEARMSPQLHRTVYGYSPAPFMHHKRYEGFRPMVFMHSGLMVGMWMASAALMCLWLRISGSLKRLAGLPLELWLGALIVVAVICKTALAIGLLLVGILGLLTARWFRSSLPVAMLMALVVGYIGLRATSLWDAQELVEFSAWLIDDSRAQSLSFRLENEDRLAAHAMQRPMFGWGFWGRSRVTDDLGQDISVTDGLWIITLGKTGLVGLAALCGCVLLGPLVFLWRFSARRWCDPPLMAGAVCALLLVLHMIDNLLNAFPNPVFMVMAGGLAGLTVMLGWAGRRQRHTGDSRLARRTIEDYATGDDDHGKPDLITP